MAISKVRLFSVPVTDQERAKAFYVGMLGFDVIAEMPMGADQQWIQVAPRGAQTSLTLVTWFPSMPPGSVQGIVLETDDIDADFTAMRARGVDFTGGIQEEPWGRSAVFTDPDGNGLVLQMSVVADS